MEASWGHVPSRAFRLPKESLVAQGYHKKMDCSQVLVYPKAYMYFLPFYPAQVDTYNLNLTGSKIESVCFCILRCWWIKLVIHRSVDQKKTGGVWSPMVARSLAGHPGHEICIDYLIVYFEPVTL